MRSHYAVSHLLIAYPAGHHDHAAVHAHPHVLSRDKERVTVVAVLAAEFTVYPYPLAHGNPAGERYITVTPFRMLMERLACPEKQDTDPFLSHHLCHGVL
jgi:hypothetical protein